MLLDCRLSYKLGRVAPCLRSWSKNSRRSHGGKGLICGKNFSTFMCQEKGKRFETLVFMHFVHLYCVSEWNARGCCRTTFPCNFYRSDCNFQMENQKQLRCLSKLEVKLKYQRALVPLLIAEMLFCVLKVFWRLLWVEEEGGKSG